MGRRSAISRLPREIREEVNRLLKGGATIDQVVAQLKGMDVEVSRSAVGRYRQDFERTGARIREAREIATVWVDRLGSEPEGDVGRLLIEMLRTIAFRTAMEAGDAAEPMKPGDVMFLGRALRELEQAGKLSADRELKVREAVRKEVEAKAGEAAKVVENIGKRAGLSVEMAAQIREQILGIPRAA